MNYPMKFRTVKYWILGCGLLFCAAKTRAQEGDIARKDVPAYVGLVNDFAGVLSKEDAAKLEQSLRRYEDSSSTQIVVVIEKTLNGRDQFDRSMDFSRQWGVGQLGKNNGIVVYLAIEERKLSIRTASATQGALTDGETGEIRRQIMQPLLKQGDYYGALDQGTQAVMAALAGEFKADKKSKGKGDAPGWVTILIVLFIILASAIRGKRGGNRGFGGSGPYYWGGGGFGGGSSGSSWGGMGGGGGFNGGGSDGGW